MSDLPGFLGDLSGWAPVGAGGVLLLVVVAILRGYLMPRGLMPTEESRTLVGDVKAAFDERVREVQSLAEARVKDAQIRAERAEGDAERWREVWIESERGRRLAADQVDALLAGVNKILEMLQSEAARPWQKTQQK